MGGRLEIGFTAPLAPSDPDTGTGISRFTFEVTFSGVQRDVEFLPTEDEPYLSEDGCTAYYPIDKGLLRKIEGLGFRDLRVRLRGDFVLDTDGHPIDADFRSEEHTSELQSLMRISYAVFCLKKKTRITR